MRTSFPSAGRCLAFAALAVVLLAGPGTGTARTMQVCTGPQNTLPPPAGCFTVDTSVIGGRAFEDYVVTRPGSLYFDLGSRRKELASLSPDTSALYCAVNPAARVRSSLPTLTFASSRLHIHTQQWTQDDGAVITADVARLTYVELRTTDGLAIPEIEIAFTRIRSGWSGQPLAVAFWVTGMAVPPRLHQQWFEIDMATDVFTRPRFVTLPEADRRLLFALFDGLPARLAAAAPGTTSPGPADPPWTLAAILEHAAYFESVVFATPQPRFDPVVTLNCGLTGGYQTCAEEPTVRAFADYMQRYGADYLASGDPAMRVGLLDNLRTWAAADALSVVPGLVFGQPNLGDFQPKYLVQQFLLPTITSWSLLRNDPLVSPADRTLIDAWLDRVVSRFTEPYGGPQNDHMVWNPGYLTLAVRMAWGIVKGNHLAVAEGVERVLMAVHQMRADGSFPREVARGSCALLYQAVQTHHLMVLAELAAWQGYDVYALRVDGKSLHDAVEFIVEVMEDPTVIAGYAATDATNCGLPPGAPLAIPGVVGEGDTNFAWIEAYLSRFPSHPHAERIRALEQGGLASHRPVHHILSGANTTCAFAQTTFQINAGLNDAWYYPVTNGQGFFINVFPALGYVSLSWFTYDTVRPPENVTANLAEPGHRWLNAVGQYAGNRAVLNISYASGGLFDSPTPVKEIGDGTIILTFDDCNNGTVEYDIPSIGKKGSVPIQRIAADNIALCKSLSQQAPSQQSNPAQKTGDNASLQSGNPAAKLEAATLTKMNAGLNDAWYYPLTNGQGFFINVFPVLGYVALSWFTYDTERPAAGVIAKLGDPGHRWLNAVGPYADNQALLNISYASGGLFDSSTPVTEITDGTITLTFSDCNSGTVEYNIPSINRQGTVPIQRVAADNIALCEALDAD